jgi:exodeoxyribonuclease VII small subunit
LAKKAQKKAAAKESEQVETQPFEESLDELQQIVNQLEDGSLPLDDSMKQFERGIALLKDCYRVLGEAEQQIEILTSVDSNGEIQTAPFDASATFDSETSNGSNDKSKSDSLF